MTALVTTALLLQSATAVAPTWWTTRGVFKEGSPVVDDYRALNQGQLKNLVRSAVEEMNAKLPGGAGTTLNTLLATWRTNATNGTSDDYAAVNAGQLKAIGKLVRTRLVEAGLTAPTMGTAGTGDDDDYALVNVGQAKAVFAFEIAPPFVDLDGDGIDDAWETLMFDALTHNQFHDTDGDGATDLEEYLANTNPKDWRSHPGAADEAAVLLSVYTPLVR